MDPTIIIFFALAAFLTYKLYTVLGTRGGHEPSEENDPLAGVRQSAAAARDQAEDAEAAPARREGPQPEWVRTVRESYPKFDGPHFLTGAKSAYEMIVQSFASGDLETIRPYVDGQVLGAFDVAVQGRQQAGQTMEVTFVGIERADVEHVSDREDFVELTVAFQSDQIRVMRDDSGEIVDGDPNRIDLVKDRWTFARSKRANDPNWTLIATDGAAPADV